MAGGGSLGDLLPSPNLQIQPQHIADLRNMLRPEMAPLGNIPLDRFFGWASV